MDEPPISPAIAHAIRHAVMAGKLRAFVRRQLATGGCAGLTGIADRHSTLVRDLLSADLTRGDRW